MTIPTIEYRGHELRAGPIRDFVGGAYHEV